MVVQSKEEAEGKVKAKLSAVLPSFLTVVLQKVYPAYAKDRSFAVRASVQV